VNDFWNDPEDDADEDEGGYCPQCAGSGEGMYDGTRCSSCGGSGGERDDSGREDYEADRADERNDARLLDD
jgi:hypothetical protein